MFGKDKKKRSRRVNTKYGQKTLKHARKGIQSIYPDSDFAGYVFLISFIQTPKSEPESINCQCKQCKTKKSYDYIYISLHQK